MAKRPKQLNNVKSLQNDYFRTADSQIKGKKKQKLSIRGRMVLFGAIGIITLAMLITTYISQHNRLAEKEQLKKEAEEELQLVKEQQEMLNLQISKLKDDDYIAKLARKEYFLSEEGEIIFTIPEDESTANE